MGFSNGGFHILPIPAPGGLAGCFWAMMATLERDPLIRCYAPGEGRILNIHALDLAMELADGGLNLHLQAGPLAWEMR